MSKEIQRKILQALGFASLGILALIVILLVAFPFLISSDLPRADMVEKYRTDNSFIYQLPSGAMAHISDSGGPDKPALLLIHGANASLHTWQPWVDKLRDDYRLISFDLPGHGLTGATPEDDYSRAAMARFTQEIITLFNLQRVTLVGNSMGGGVALQVALDAPQSVEALVLISSVGMQRDADDGSVGAFRLTGSPLGRLLLRYVTPRFAVASTLRGVVAAPKTISDAAIDRYWELLRMTGSRDASIKRLQAYDTAPPLEPQLSRIKTPTLILWGQQDKLIKADYGIKMNAAIVGSFLRLYPQAGHLAHEEIPEKTTADLRAFFALLDDRPYRATKNIN